LELAGTTAKAKLTYFIARFFVARKFSAKPIATSMPSIAPFFMTDLQRVFE